MGLSIHYSAALRKASDLSEIVLEATEMANALNWKSNVIVTSGLGGIVISPPNCEPLSLCFTPDGKTCSLENFNHSNPSDEHYSTIHIKTAYAGPEIHKAVIDILIYVNEKYLGEMQVYDESGYWDTRDYEKLVTRFGMGSKNM